MKRGDEWNRPARQTSFPLEMQSAMPSGRRKKPFGWRLKERAIGLLLGNVVFLFSSQENNQCQPTSPTAQHASNRSGMSAMAEVCFCSEESAWERPIWPRRLSANSSEAVSDAGLVEADPDGVGTSFVPNSSENSLFSSSMPCSRVKGSALRRAPAEVLL